jgi:AbrB family looped-hinge helix DNA binding protein
MVAKSKPRKKTILDTLPRTLPTRITKGGQITLPAEARAVLGVKPGDQVYVRIEGDQVKVLKPKYSLQDVFNSPLPLPRPGYDIEQGIEEAKEEMVEHVMRTMG